MTLNLLSVVYIVTEYMLKELNPRRRVYVEIPKPSRVELKCSFSDTLKE
jgi:hypothetical protein